MFKRFVDNQYDVEIFLHAYLCLLFTNKLTWLSSSRHPKLSCIVSHTLFSFFERRLIVFIYLLPIIFARNLVKSKFEIVNDICVHVNEHPLLAPASWIFKFHPVAQSQAHGCEHRKLVTTIDVLLSSNQSTTNLTKDGTKEYCVVLLDLWFVFAIIVGTIFVPNLRINLWDYVVEFLFGQYL